MRAATLLALAVAVGLVCADTYLHNPRGSNNRLNEQSANRDNADRMFNSQNNNRGGYNKGDYSDQPANVNPADTLALQYLQQYDEFFYMSETNWKKQGTPGAVNTGRSQLTIEWTNQHGCGGNEQTDPNIDNCVIVLQYMCFPEPNGTFAVWNKGREACDMECYVPRPKDNPTCIDDYPACDTIPLEYTACTKAGGLWLPARFNDQYNCPHDCTNHPASANHQDCNLNSGTWQAANARTSGEWYPRLRDGTTTNRQEYQAPTTTTETEARRFQREWRTNPVRLDRGLHEDWTWYDECNRRERNAGIFTADQILQQNNLGYVAATATRQNPNNNRNGYECPEERDYYPYWHTSPWTDIAVLTDRLDLCDFYQAESQNVKQKWSCRNTATCPNCIRYNNEAACLANSGNWVASGARNIDPPECTLAPWTRDNHNGNTRGGQASRYNWTIPSLTLPNGQAVNYKCVFRLRYNISTDDYDAWRVNSSFNQNDGQGVRSPVQQNPTVNIGANNQGLRLAINTAQYGRTFQDRSHVFTLKARPYSQTADPAFFTDKNIYNVNVRGKRGNIVQVYPAVEYDFIPNELTVNADELVHFQVCLF